MFIDLPASYYYKDSTGRNLAWIRNSTLEVMNGSVSFNDLMYAMTYRLKGKERCSYCGKLLKNGNRTLDHIIPRDLGAPTITNNLTPSCSNCNSTKNNMMPWEYEEYLMLGRAEKQIFLREVNIRHEQIKFCSGFKLPYGWVDTAFTEDIEIPRIPSHINLQTVSEFYEKYGNLRKPVVIDQKGILIDGLRVLLFTEKMRIKRIPVIVLENVSIVSR